MQSHYSSLLTNKFYQLPPPVIMEEKPVSFPVPDSIETLEAFSKSSNGQEFRSGIQNMITELTTWTEKVWKDEPDSKSEFLQLIDHFKKRFDYSGQDSEENSKIFILFTEGVKNLNYILYAIHQNNLPIYIYKNLMMELFRSMAECSGGTHTYLFLTALNLKNDPYQKIYAIKDLLLTQFILELLSEDEVLNKLDVGYEIHLANWLKNKNRDWLGLHNNDDPQATDEFLQQEIVAGLTEFNNNVFHQKIKNHITLETLIQSMMLEIAPALDEMLVELQTMVFEKPIHLIEHTQKIEAYLAVYGSDLSFNSCCIFREDLSLLPRLELIENIKSSLTQRLNNSGYLNFDLVPVVIAECEWTILPFTSVSFCFVESKQLQFRLPVLSYILQFGMSPYLKQCQFFSKEQREELRGKLIAAIATGEYSSLFDEIIHDEDCLDELVTESSHYLNLKRILFAIETLQQPDLVFSYLPSLTDAEIKFLIPYRSPSQNSIFHLGVLGISFANYLMTYHRVNLQNNFLTQNAKHMTPADLLVAFASSDVIRCLLPLFNGFKLTNVFIHSATFVTHLCNRFINDLDLLDHFFQKNVMHFSLITKQIATDAYPAYLKYCKNVLGYNTPPQTTVLTLAKLKILLIEFPQLDLNEYLPVSQLLFLTDENLILYLLNQFKLEKFRTFSAEDFKILCCDHPKIVKVFLLKCDNAIAELFLCQEYPEHSGNALQFVFHQFKQGELNTFYKKIGPELTAKSRHARDLEFLGNCNTMPYLLREYLDNHNAYLIADEQLLGQRNDLLQLIQNEVTGCFYIFHKISFVRVKEILNLNIEDNLTVFQAMIVDEFLLQEFASYLMSLPVLTHDVVEYFGNDLLATIFLSLDKFILLPFIEKFYDPQTIAVLIDFKEEEGERRSLLEEILIDTDCINTLLCFLCRLHHQNYFSFAKDADGNYVNPLALRLIDNRFFVEALLNFNLDPAVFFEFTTRFKLADIEDMTALSNSLNSFKMFLEAMSCFPERAIAQRDYLIEFFYVNHYFLPIKKLHPILPANSQAVLLSFIQNAQHSKNPALKINAKLGLIHFNPDNLDNEKRFFHLIEIYQLSSSKIFLYFNVYEKNNVELKKEIITSLFLHLEKDNHNALPVLFEAVASLIVLVKMNLIDVVYLSEIRDRLLKARDFFSADNYLQFAKIFRLHPHVEEKYIHFPLEYEFAQIARNMALAENNEALVEKANVVIKEFGDPNAEALIRFSNQGLFSQSLSAPAAATASPKASY